jgi:AbrB family looped-hinge helix DNA binding protein
MSAQQILLQLLGQECSSCGSTENLVLHHIDGNRENNDLRNITLLCKLCHEKTHGFRDEQGTPLVKAVKIGNSIRMTIPKPVVDYLKIGAGDTLEITVQDTEMVVKKK